MENDNILLGECQYCRLLLIKYRKAETTHSCPSVSNRTLLFRSLSNLSKMALTIISMRYKYDGHDFIMSYNCCTTTNILMYLFQLTANHFSCVTLPLEGLQFTAMFVLVFLSQHMHNSKNHMSKSHKIFCTLSVTMAWSSCDYDDVLCMTSRFHITGQIRIQATHGQIIHHDSLGGAAELHTWRQSAIVNFHLLDYFSHYEN